MSGQFWALVDGREVKSHNYMCNTFVSALIHGI